MLESNVQNQIQTVIKYPYDESDNYSQMCELTLRI